MVWGPEQLDRNDDDPPPPPLSNLAWEREMIIWLCECEKVRRERGAEVEDSAGTFTFPRCLNPGRPAFSSHPLLSHVMFPTVTFFFFFLSLSPTVCSYQNSTPPCSVACWGWWSVDELTADTGLAGSLMPPHQGERAVMFCIEEVLIEVRQTFGMEEGGMGTWELWEDMYGLMYWVQTGWGLHGAVVQYLCEVGERLIGVI